MRILFTFLTLFLFFKILPAQEINLSSQVDSFILCTSVTTETGEPIGQVNSQLSGYTGAPGMPFPNPFNLGACGTIYPQYVNGFITLNPKLNIKYRRFSDGGIETLDYLPPMDASIFFWIPSRLKDPGDWLGGYSCMVMRNCPATLCIGPRT